MVSGKFVTLEGPDGSGKSTGLTWLFDYLQSIGVNCIRSREPGGTPLAERIRELLLSPTDETWDPKAELLSFAAARNQHLEEVIYPHLNRGVHVICDRFMDSTYAYQGAGRGFRKEVGILDKWVLKGFEPDCTLFFSIDEETAAKRLAARIEKSDRLDNELADFFSRVRQGYNERYEEHKHRMYRIDANGTIPDVQAQLRDWAHNYFNIP